MNKYPVGFMVQERMLALTIWVSESDENDTPAWTRAKGQKWNDKLDY